jgi:acetylornithine deacetylase/succinyl-diaminopimelate desuccinylase-like protein
MIGDAPVTYEVLATIADPGAVNREAMDAFYEQLGKAIATERLKTSPLYFEATTDLRYYQYEGIVGLGFTPFTCPDNLHGIDESVPVKDLERGVRIMREFLVEFCA